MAGKRNVVTGATGLLGSHVVEQLLARGERVRALVRPGSDTAFLHELGVELAPGDLNDPASLRPALGGADIVYHCAAQVGEWGPWRLFQQGIIDATANLLDACQAVGVGRVLHVSSVRVYGFAARGTAPVTESAPLGKGAWLWDYYSAGKIAAERLCQSYPGDWTIVRPSWIYGPRDRRGLPRSVKALRAGRVGVIGRGDNLLNLVHAADVADGAIRAANHPGARAGAYNLCSEGDITQRQFLDTLTDALGLPRLRRHFPYWLAYTGGFLSECVGKAIRLGRPPHFTRFVVTLVSRPTCYSTAKASGELGWSPKVSPFDGLRDALAWHFAHESAVRAQPEKHLELSKS
jgi:nucleoside-diphosphate-sugar epimerase